MYFVGGKSSEGFEPSSEVAGVDEVGAVLPEVLVGLVIEALDGCLLEGSVYAFDLAVGPGMVGFGQTMIEVCSCAGQLEGMVRAHP